MAKKSKGRKKRRTQEMNEKVKALKESFGSNFTDEEIRAALLQCDMDSDKAFNRLNDGLDSQVKFQEVKTKHGRRETEGQGPNASSSNTGEVTIVDAENTRENPLVAPSVTSASSLSNDMIAMNEPSSWNRFGVLQNIDSHMAKEETSSTTKSAESDCSFTDCVTQFNDGSADDSSYEAATDLSLEQEEKEDLSLSIDTSTVVLPECVPGRDADYLCLSSDVNIAIPCDLVASNLEGSTNINGNSQITEDPLCGEKSGSTSHTVTEEGDAANTGENVSVTPLATPFSSSCNRQIARCGIISPSPESSCRIQPTIIRDPRSSGYKNSADVVRFGGHRATVSHMVGKTSSTSDDNSPVEEFFKKSEEVQVSKHDVTGENSSSKIAESNRSFTEEGDTCKVEGASQSNDGSVEDMASHNLPVEENERHEAGSRSSKNDIPATALSLDQLTLGEDKEVPSLSDNTSTMVLPEGVQAQDAEFSHLCSGAINSDVNTAIPLNESDPVKNNLNDSSANLNGSSGNISTLAPVPAKKILSFREYHPIHRARSVVEPNRSSSLTGHNAALSSLQQSYLGDPNFSNTSSFNFHPYGNISAQRNSPWSMLDNFSNLPNQYGTGHYGVQRAQANNLAMSQQYQSGSRTLPTSGQARGRSPSIQGSRFHNSNQQLVLDIQRRNQLQPGIPDDRFSRQIPDWPFIPFQSDFPGSRHQSYQGQTHLLPRSNHFPQASSTALLQTDPCNFPPGSSNQSLQGSGQGHVGIIGPSRNSPGQSQGSSQSDAAFRLRDAGSSTALDRRYELFPRHSQPLLSSSIFTSTSFFSTSIYQNSQGQEEKPSEGDGAFPDPQSSLPPGLPESSSDRTQGSSEEQEQP